MLEVGAIIAGKLRVERILGSGGMGVVAAARRASCPDTDGGDAEPDRRSPRGSRS